MEAGYLISLAIVYRQVSEKKFFENQYESEMFRLLADDLLSWTLERNAMEDD